MNVEKIQTTKELRKLLSDVMESVETGELDLGRAYHIANLAASVNESFMVDLHEAKLRLLERRMTL
jgi:hypothetical protein